jgi:hypothetical protein
LGGCGSAVSEDVDLVHGPIGLKQLLEFGFRPGAGDLANEHLDGVMVRGIQVLHRTIHPAAVAAVAVGKRWRGKKDLVQYLV